MATTNMTPPRPTISLSSRSRTCLEIAAQLFPTIRALGHAPNVAAKVALDEAEVLVQAAETRELAELDAANQKLQDLQHD